jgi:osmoprotectant transport system substrate-binding protein
VDVVIDYLGTALAFARPQFARPPEAAEQMHAVLARTMGGRGVDVLSASAAEDQNGFAVTKDFAETHGISRLSELTPLAADLAFGGPPECPDRPFCLLGLEQVYGLRFGRFVPLDSGGPLTLAALREQNIDVGVLFSTDPNLVGREFVELADDRSLQPAENVVPAVRTAVLERWGNELREPLDAVSAALTTEELRELNRQVVLGGATPRRAARTWLAQLASA